MQDVNTKKMWSFIADLRGTEYEIWLYQPLDVLLSIKGVYDKKIAQSSVAAIKDMLREPVQDMDITRGLCYDPVLIYSNALETAMTITTLMQYKKNVLQKSYMAWISEYNEAKEIIFHAIREDAKTSYFDLLAREGTEQKNLNYALERMIQKRTLSAVITGEEGTQKFDGWIIKT